jgi:hypothetical protein
VEELEGLSPLVGLKKSSSKAGLVDVEVEEEVPLKESKIESREGSEAEAEGGGAGPGAAKRPS